MALTDDDVRKILTTDNIIPAPPGSTNSDGTVNAYWSMSSYLQWTYRRADLALTKAAAQEVAIKGLVAAVQGVDEEAVLAAVREEGARLARLAAEGQARDTAAAAAIAEAVKEVAAIRSTLESAEGDPDLAPIMARIDHLPDLIATAGRTAGEAASRATLERLAAAQQASAEMLGGSP